jgi:hypothetical protein
MALILDGTNGLSDVDGSAATPAIRGSDTNTGIFFPGADRIGFAEGGVQVGEFDASGNFQFNSGYGSAAVAYGCRAWVNFNGIGTPSIRASGNVSSVTKAATGQFNINFAVGMPDTNYCVHVTSSFGSSDAGGGNDAPYINGIGTLRRENGNTATTQCKIVTGFDFATSTQDHAQTFVSVFR